jgi:hypothetical protein
MISGFGAMGYRLWVLDSRGLGYLVLGIGFRVQG